MNSVSELTVKDCWQIGRDSCDNPTDSRVALCATAAAWMAIARNSGIDRECAALAIGRQFVLQFEEHTFEPDASLTCRICVIPGLTPLLTIVARE